MMRRLYPMAPEGGVETAAGPAGAGAGAGPAAPAAPEQPAAEAKAEVLGTPGLRERLAEARSKKESQLDELRKALEEQATTAATLKAELEALRTEAAKEREGAAAKSREDRIRKALADAKIAEKWHGHALTQLQGIDVTKDGWQAAIDKFATDWPETVERQERVIPPSEWVAPTLKALGGRAERTLLGSIAADKVATLMSGRR